MSNDPNRMIRYPLSWPAWMGEKVAEAANARAMSVATWLREAALEKLQRDKEKAVTLEEAIEELRAPTGDPEKDAVRAGFAENMRDGFLQPAGRTKDGDVAVKLTLAGKRMVEQMGKDR